MHETPIEEFERQFTLNLRPDLPRDARRRSRAMQTAPSSAWARARALRPFPAAAGYMASKAALLALVRALDAEYRDDGIRVNAVLPSVIDTPANRASMPDADHASWVAPAQIARRHPLPHAATPARRSAAPRSPSTAAPEKHPNRWWTLGAVCVATFMLLLDITVVNVALPDIAEDLDASFSDLQWVVDAYALSLAALPADGRLARRPLRPPPRLRPGLVDLHARLAALRAVATTPTLLNLARALQGIGGAAMFATSLALIAQAFSGPERGTAFGIWGATIGGAVAIGPLVGGVLTEQIGWESIFFVNVPIGIAGDRASR